MERIHTFIAPPLIRICHSEGTLTDAAGKFLGILEKEERFLSTAIVRREERLYFLTAAGFVPLEAAAFLTQSFFLETEPLQQSQTAQVKASRGTVSLDEHGKQLRQLPLKTSVILIEKARSLLGDEWVKTTTDEWVKTEDLYFSGSSFVLKQEETPYTGLTVVSPTGAELCADTFAVKGELLQGTKRMVQGKVLDVFGDHWWQTDAGFVRTDDCLAWEVLEEYSCKDYQLLGAENINQDFWGIPNGCEAASLLQGFHYQGLLWEVDYQSWIDQMPISPEYDPYEGFGGSPYGIAKGRFEAIFPPALLKWGRRYGRLRDLMGADDAALSQALRRGNPVIAYVTIDFTEPEPDTYPWGATFANNHAVLLDGETQELWHVSDPIAGKYWLPKTYFARSYDPRRWAIEVLP